MSNAKAWKSAEIAAHVAALALHFFSNRKHYLSLTPYQRTRQTAA